MFDYKGKVVAITGSTGGVGKQMAEGFAKVGANLALLTSDLKRAETVGKELEEKYGVKALPLMCDVTSPESIDAAVSKVYEVFGHCEVIINNLGSVKGVGNPLEKYNQGDWDFTIAYGLTSVFKVTKSFVNLMKHCISSGKQAYGRVINISSIYGLVGNKEIPVIAHYTSKGGVVNFTRGAAAELGTQKITVNCICPGEFYDEFTKETLDTEYFQNLAKRMIPIQRYGNPGELDAAAIFLGSEEASYVTGQVICVDGGYTCL